MLNYIMNIGKHCIIHLSLFLAHYVNKEGTRINWQINKGEEE